MRCVIVDDNGDFLDAATRLLEHQGIRWSRWRLSAEGLQCVENLRPDVTLADIGLGDASVLNSSSGFTATGSAPTCRLY